MFAIKWAMVGLDAPAGARGKAAPQAQTFETVIAAEDPETRDKWVAIFRYHIQRQEAVEAAADGGEAT